MNQPAKRDVLRFRLWQVLTAVTVLSILCAIVPGAAIVIVGGTPTALGFLLFVIADQKEHEGYRILGAVLMALGLFVGTFAMTFVGGPAG